MHTLQDAIVMEETWFKESDKTTCGKPCSWDRWSKGVTSTTPGLARLRVSRSMARHDRMSLVTSFLPHPIVQCLIQTYPYTATESPDIFISVLQLYYAILNQNSTQYETLKPVLQTRTQQLFYLMPLHLLFYILLFRKLTW